MVYQLLLHFFEGKETAIDPPLPLAEQSMDSLYGVHLSVSIGEVRHIIVTLMDTHAENSIFSEVYVLIVEHLLFGFLINIEAARIDEVGQQHSEEDIGNAQICLDYPAVLQLLVNRLEVGLKQFVVVFLLVIEDGLHVVGRERTRQDVNEAKRGLEGLVHQMCEVVFHLLCPLDICELKGDISQEIHIFILDLIILLQFLDL